MTFCVITPSADEKQTQDELRGVALPFHPHCFELYIQATRLYNDCVDLDTLVHIRDKACIRGEKFPVSYSDEVQAATGQYWQHRVGHEYLVANPIFVPGLRATLESAISTEESFNVHNSAFKQRPQRDSSSSKDPFLPLPLEIILDIAGSLDSNDLAYVRLASRAFTNLPISFFRQLVFDEMPWLYEAWSPETSPYHWATAVAHDKLKEKRELKKFSHELERRRNIILEFEPEIYDEFVANEPKWEWPEHPETREMLDMGPITLPRDRTNWYQVFCDIRLNRAGLKGLRNRERIWRNVTQVVDAIKKARDGLDFI